MYDYVCANPLCSGELHLSACFQDRAIAYRALELLGWTPVKSQWLCPDCNSTPAPPTEIPITTL